MIHFAAVWLSSKYRRFYHYGTNPFPIQAVEQRHELGMVELHPSGPDPRPAERGFLEPLGKEADPAAIPPDNLDPVRRSTLILHTNCEICGSNIPGTRYSAGFCMPVMAAADTVRTRSW